VMILPLFIMLGWRSETHGGGTGDWFNWTTKFHWLLMALRDRWKLWDVASLVVALVVIVEARRQKPLTFSRNLAFSALVLLAGYLVLPRIIFGSAYADMRLIPYVIATALLAIRFRDQMEWKRASILAGIGIAFYLLRIGSTTASLAIAADDQQAKLEALEHVPMGSRVVSQVGMPCTGLWALPRNSHLGAMAIVRRHGFANDQWVVEGANLLELEYVEAGRFAADPSQIVRPNACPDGLRLTIDQSLKALPRDKFDYVWLVDVPAHDPTLVEGMEAVWRGPGSILYRIKQ